ncbi:putative AAA family protein [Rosellinia necatrix]|uniref:Putative AAA family protein n=1 Tax=Rosellinia necatrix TaxID=77044 RepID=A0A1W2TEV4_ROSNE|nr:putative AAA family protein [Rosellinia necatrix]
MDVKTGPRVAVNSAQLGTNFGNILEGDAMASRAAPTTDDTQDEEEDTKPKHQNSKSDIAGIPDTLNGEFMHHWVKDIHSRIAVLEEDLGAKDETAIEGKLEYGARDMFYTVPRVRECDWNHYKNKYSEEDCNASIDVLVSSHDFVADVETEYVARMSPDQRQKYIGVPRAWIRPATLNEVQTGPRFERIRINSGIILAYLDKTNNRTSWTASLPHTFYKPFKTIIHFHDMMEESLRVLESKYGTVCESESAGTTQSAVKSEEGAIGHGGTAMSQDASAIIGDNNDLLGAPESQQSINFPQTPRHGNFIHRDEVPAFMDSVQAYRDMKVYVNFINERIMPSYRMFEGADYSSNRKVRYDELWWLFRIGELLYEQAQPDKELSAIGIQGPQSAPTTHRLWRLHDIYLPIQIVEVMPKDLLHMQGVEFQEKKDTISINVYHIDFDGGDYSAVTKTFHIPQYDGEKEIHELPIFPLRFMKEGASIFEKLKERGRTFQTVLSKGKAAMAYDGWTLIRDPTGDVMEDFDGNEMTTPEYINSDVIIDFREAFLTYPHWQPDFPKYIKTNLQSETRRDPYPIIQWVDADRSKQVRQWSEMVAVKESVDNLRWNEFSATDSFLCDLPDDIGTRTATELVLSDEDLALLPSRLFAYALRDRKFIVIDISKLKEIPPVSNQFDDLEIPQNHKTMILSIVYDHFEKKKVRQAAALQGFEAHDQDFIRGKGRGIVILLHGAPGVGKTATAEAVAHAQNKPLFPITCGDLGTTPEVVEERLQETFRLANLWDCVRQIKHRARYQLPYGVALEIYLYI